MRRRAQAHFQRILLDEFQDTDPLQIEIAWLLAGREDQLHIRDWRELALAPGRLFVVGDPKQSIYRFRRADIGTFQDVHERVAEHERVQLLQNFRTGTPILSWVNHQLGLDMQHRPRISPAYAPLAPRLSSPDEGGMYRAGGEFERAPQKWQNEANAVALLAHRAVREHWPVSSPDGSWREARYADICVLLPARTNLRRLERAFDRHNVPYRMDSGSLVLHTQEVRDLLSCLRAIEDPSDQVALVAALRSPAYACSDVDLLAWTDAGGRLDYESAYEPSPGAAGEGRVRAPTGLESSAIADAFESLRAFHALAQSRPAAYVAEAFIRQRCLALQAFGQARPRDTWRRLRYVVAQARRLAAAGQPSLAEVLDWLEGLQAGRFYDPDSPAAEGDDDAVRLLTVHAAKGLEFPIVIVTGLGASPPAPRSPDVLADHRTGQLELRLGVRWRTNGYDEALERAAREAEQVRLLYVAATRARDHLVLCLFHDQRASPAKRILERLQSAPNGLCIELDLSDEPDAAPARDVPAADAQAPLVAAEAHRAEEEAWLARRQRQLARLGVRPRRTPSQLAHARPDVPVLSQREAGAFRSTPPPVEDETTRRDYEDEDLADDATSGLDLEDDGTLPPTMFGGRGATALGRAVHAVLQLTDWSRPGADVPQLASSMARGFSIIEREDEVRRLAEAVLASPALQAARHAQRAWREAPAGVSIDGTLLEGCIDLLYQRDDGQLVVIDYKTDRVSNATVAERAAAYRLQGAAYAVAVEQASGAKVAAVQLVFAALDGQVIAFEGSDLEAARAEVARRMSLS
mgnify:CR=1 FL=1